MSAASAIAGLIVVSLSAGCLRSTYVLKIMNAPPAPNETPRARARQEQIERIVRTHLVDSYIQKDRAGEWLQTLAHEPDPIMELIRELRMRPDDVASPYARFFRTVASKDSVWGVPGRPSLDVVQKPLLHDQEAGIELDAERFINNARAIASSILRLEGLVGADPFTDGDIKEGIRKGAEKAKTYVQARNWRRQVGHHPTALVMSGGAANGAFTAGFVWRLLEVLDTCHKAEPYCTDARFDLIMGTSTGALVGAMVDLFATSPQRARELLLKNYTCVVEADLYCVNDVSVLKLAKNVRGLVRFDGVRSRLEPIVNKDTIENATELVTLSVDYESGDLFAESDQDPSDGLTVKGRIDAVMASVVEPIMAEPVESLERPNHTSLMGTFIDGGVRSEIPLMEAVRRGAERALVIGTSGLEPNVRPRQRNAFEMLTRTLDLVIDQVAVGELQEAEFFAQARRLGEFNICGERLGPGASRFCTRRALRPGATEEEAGAAPFLGPDRLFEVDESWRSLWIVKPEGGAQSANGYAMKPAVMRPLFLLGVKTFQRRCEETLRLVDVPSGVRDIECSDGAGKAALRKAETEMARCQPGPDEARTCSK